MNSKTYFTEWKLHKGCIAPTQRPIHCIQRHSMPIKNWCFLVCICPFAGLFLCRGIKGDTSVLDLVLFIKFALSESHFEHLSEHFALVLLIYSSVITIVVNISRGATINSQFFTAFCQSHRKCEAFSCFVSAFSLFRALHPRHGECTSFECDFWKHILCNVIISAR